MRNFGPQQAADRKAATACLEAAQPGEPPARADGPPADHGDGGAASFAACARLFSSYPLAVMPRFAGGEYRSLVLVRRAPGAAAFFALTQPGDDLFVLRSWGPDNGISQEIRPGESVPDFVCQVIADGMPIPRDRALLGWVTDRQVTAMLAVHSGQPATREAPEIRVMPLCPSSQLDWPPFTTSPFTDGRLWNYIERGQMVNIAPLLTRSAGHAFWVPCPHGRSTGYVVVQDNLPADQYWLPAGVYMDHWRLREGIQAPPAGHLVGLPGAVDLARGAW